ncbi:MAG TPA: phosphate regulon sensor histidine kinase PhoR [Burkholderiaceae bacterium]|nr:phosphate regulon sensor histidine kinase PhoR [Burkholderiaceae bacterium]
MRQSLWREVWILAILVGAGWSFGALTQHPFLFPAIALLFYIGLQLRQLNRLHQWLMSDRRSEPPDAAGLWGDVFNEVRKLVRAADRRADELTDALARFQSAAAAMPDGVVILTEEEGIEWANPPAATLLGINYPRDAGMRFSNLLRDPDFADYLKGGDYAEPLEIDSPANPELSVSLQIVPFGAQRKLVLARDSTRMHRLEQMRRIFVANVSHELRTPVTVLGGYIETLREIEYIRSEDLKKHLTTMHEQATRMQRLVDDLLMLSRLETAAPRHKEEAVDVPALLAGLREQAEVLSGDAGHRITLDAESNLKLLGGRDELHSAFMNLIQNAVRYSPRGGAIGLRWYSDDGGAKFSVTDTGDGVAPEHIPHLTERFYRVDTARSRASGGTGLGLSIVKHVLLRHGAHLDIRSELGHGSTFTCVFPSVRVTRAVQSSRAASRH